MKTSNLLVSLAVLLSVVALVLSLARTEVAVERQRDSLHLVDRSVEAELEAQVRALQERLASLELRPAPTQRAPAAGEFVSREEFEALRAELQQLIAASGGTLASDELGSLEFKAHVTGVLSELQEDRKSQALAKQQEQQSAWLDKALPTYQEQLGLTLTQTNQMRSALLASFERAAELGRRWSEGEDAGVLGEIKRADYETHQLELAEILTLDQLETYSSLRQTKK